MSNFQYDHYSHTSLPVSVGFDETPLSTATAFFVDFGGNLLLFTNWHVVSGRHFDTQKPLSKNAAIPNWIEIGFRLDGNPLQLQKVRVPLYENDHPVWIEHPQARCDVVGLIVPRPSGTFIHTTNTALAKQDIRLEPATPVSIVGYPEGISVGGALPVWKTGTIASEPTVDVNNYQAFLIDAATRRGMSGSPVIWKVRDHYLNNEGDLMIPTTPGNVFLGIYSGRHGRDDALGFVWRPDVLDAIASEAFSA